MVDWESYQQPESDKPCFIAFPEGKAVTVRILSQPFAFYRAFCKGKAFVVHDPYQVEGIEGCKCFQRYATNVIDRSDGKVKILAGGVQIYREILRLHKEELAKNQRLKRPLWQRALYYIAPAWLWKYIERKFPEPPQYSAPEGEVGLELRIRKRGDRYNVFFDIDGRRSIISPQEQELELHNLSEILKPSPVNEIVKDVGRDS